MEITYLMRKEKLAKERTKLESLAEHFWQVSNHTSDIKRRKRLTRRAFDYYNAAMKLRSDME